MSNVNHYLIASRDGLSTSISVISEYQYKCN